jgi:hypothetical protein
MSDVTDATGLQPMDNLGVESSADHQQKESLACPAYVDIH